MAARLVLLVVALAAFAGCDSAPRGLAGPWRARLQSPGGPLPFGIEFAEGAEGLAAFVTNGAERLPVSRVVVAANSVELRFEHFDAAIVATLAADGDRLDGEWRRTAGPGGKLSVLPFHAERGAGPRFVPGGATGDAAAIAGRWAVDFETDDDPSVGVFEAAADGRVTGTFLNTTGDYRYLEGEFGDGRLRLSAFDGAHAFLFHATLEADGTLAGDFWSRDAWHERWSARRDPEARLPDPFALTHAVDGVTLDGLAYPDLDGTPRRLDDPAFAGNARLLVAFGTWCPNCNDATGYFVELHRRYRDRGLSVVGLAFEMTGDFARDAEQVRVYGEWHGIDYPLLVAGVSDKAQASASLPLLDRLRAYPTTIFLDGDGTVRAVYQGFSGPATGPAHQALRERFEALIEELLAGAPARASG